MGVGKFWHIELSWLTGAFGEIDTAYVASDKMTRLNIGFNDNYMIQIIRKNGNKGMLIVDVVSPVAVRKLEAYAENEYISWNGTSNSICEFEIGTKKLVNVKLTETVEHEKGYCTFIVENAYKNEIREFFDVVLDHKEPMYGFEQDKEILRTIDFMGV